VSEAKIIQSLKPRLLAGPPAFTAWVSMRDPALGDVMLREGFDCLTLDWQHGFHDFDSVAAAISTAYCAGKPTLVRIGVGDFGEAARFLDWGAAGIIAPMINSVADAKALVDFLKYPPLGGRSWGPSRALGLTGLSPHDYLTTANDFTLAIAMIETREALDALDDILAMPGIDGVLVGPSDLSIALLKGATVDMNHAEVDSALNHIAARAKAHGKLAMAFCGDGNRARDVAAKGFHLCTVGTDGILMRMIAKQELAKARSESAPLKSD
jgi:4-hydroxy-2-oxoheptanedioate aldolase